MHTFLDITHFVFFPTSFAPQYSQVPDEFTSTVDRQVAKVLCIALNKTLKEHYPEKKFVAVSCHKDFIEYLQPDWVYDTDTGRTVFLSAHDLKRHSQSKNVILASGQSLGSIII